MSMHTSDLKGHVDSNRRRYGGAVQLASPENATGNYVKVVQRIPVKIRVSDCRARSSSSAAARDVGCTNGDHQEIDRAWHDCEIEHGIPRRTQRCAWGAIPRSIPGLSRLR